MSNPPQLQLSLPPHTTSFKRSFEQFGFDLESPASTLPHRHEPPHSAGSSASGESSSSSRSSTGDENRRKRARSASSLSLAFAEPDDHSSDASSSTLASFDSDSPENSNSPQVAAHRHLLLDLGLGRGLASSVAAQLSMTSELDDSAIPEPPPRIPTPVLLETEDIEMPDVRLDFSRHAGEHEDEPSQPATHAEHVRLSLDRFNAFDRHISVLRSSSPPVLPLPATLNNRQTLLSPPTLPPLPLVELGLDGENDPINEHIPSPTTATTSTPPRLNLNLPPATSLSSASTSPISPRDEDEEPSATQFRERLDSAIDGLGGGNLHFEAPTLSPTYSSDTMERQPDHAAFLDRYFESTRSINAVAGPSSEARASSSANRLGQRPHSFAQNSLFDWSPSTDWSLAPAPRRTPTSPVFEAASWRPPPPRPANATASTEATRTEFFRRLFDPASPPAFVPLPPPASRLYPRPASLAEPLSVAATSSNPDGAIEAELFGAYRSRAWDDALERARAVQRERERERDARERRERERERETERELERERETERERPWNLDSYWDAASRGESSLSDTYRATWESPMDRARREVAEDERERDLTRRRAIQRQLHQGRDLERRDEQRSRGQSPFSRAARYLESGLVDPSEAPRAVPIPGRERSLRPPTDISNPFGVSWASRSRAGADESAARPPRLRRSRSSSQSRDGTVDWGDRMDQDDGDDTFDAWLNAAPPEPGSMMARAAPSEHDGLERFRRRPDEGPSSGEHWRSRSTTPWQPRLVVSPQSTAQPTRTPAHARAQSIPSSSLASSMTAQPSATRFRLRHARPRAAGIGSATSLVAENAAEMRRREARAELIEHFTRARAVDVDMLSDAEPDTWESTLRRARDRGREGDQGMDSDEEGPSRRVAPAAEALELFAPSYYRRSDRSPVRRSPPPLAESPPLPLRLSTEFLSSRPRVSTGRFMLESDADEEPTASSSSFNSRRPFSIPPRRTVRPRHHAVNRELSPPPLASPAVDRRHVSWEAPARDTGVSQYLSALSHGFDSQSLSIADMANTISRNSNAELPPLTSHYYRWGESDSPFSSFFPRSSLQRHADPSSARSQDTDNAAEGETSVPSLPSPDYLGRVFEGADDILNVARPPALATSPPPRPPSPPPPGSSYTGPFRLTMQRREEYARRAAAARQRRGPDPPSIPPLHFGGDFDDATSPTATSHSANGSEHQTVQQRLLAQLGSRRPFSSQNPAPSRDLPSVADVEQRLLHYRGPSSPVPRNDRSADARRFFPLPTASSSSQIEPRPEAPRRHRYSATDMHNLLARQTRLEGSRLAADVPSQQPAHRLSVDAADATISRARHLISRYHEHAEAETRDPSSSSSSSSPWAALPSRRTDTERVNNTEAHRRRSDAMLRMRTHAILSGSHFLPGTGRSRRRALGDYMRDEDFDASYENLLTLSGIIGDVKPKSTPQHVIADLESGLYQEWATPESDKRCPICLDDYEPSDSVLKLADCRHWLHKECLEQWLKGARTCPVCRKDVKGKAKQRTPHHHHHHGPGPSRRREDDGPSGSGGSAGPSTTGGSNAPWMNYLRQ